MTLNVLHLFVIFFLELLSVGENNLRKKSVCYRCFENGQFVRVCYREND